MKRRTLQQILLQSHIFFYYFGQFEGPYAKSIKVNLHGSVKSCCFVIVSAIELNFANRSD